MELSTRFSLNRNFSLYETIMEIEFYLFTFSKIICLEVITVVFPKWIINLVLGIIVNGLDEFMQIE